VREYELVYVIQPDATPEREQEIHARADGLIEGAGSRVLLRDDWGKRKLAYEIKSFQKGHYFQLNFLGNGAEVAELERSLRLDQDVLRFLSIQANDKVKDVEARINEAAEQAQEQARRREERARIEAERELEREQERARMQTEDEELAAERGRSDRGRGAGGRRGGQGRGCRARGRVQTPGPARARGCRARGGVQTPGPA
jgi:small subunit ribosomal protein S6